MTHVRTHSAAVVGATGRLVEVEAEVAHGLPSFNLLGLPEEATWTIRDRVYAATLNSKNPWPHQRITVGMFPAALAKSGSGFDLAIAAAILGVTGTVPPDALGGRMFIGELALDGRLRPVRGVLPAVMAAVADGIERVVVPPANAAEAALVPGAVVEALPHLRDLPGLLRGEYTHTPEPAGRAGAPPADDPARVPDLADITWPTTGRLAVEVAAAGGHHLFLQGPAGSGKAMLADRLPGLLPPLDTAAALEVTAVHSLAGALAEGDPLVTRPPYRTPHHTVTPTAMAGAGSGTGSTAIRPGIVSQAHRGVLFLDNAPEFDRASLEVLRQPLETGFIEIARAGATIQFPADFLLVLASKPCPHAQASRASGPNSGCSTLGRCRHLFRIPAPLLDRMHIHVVLTAPNHADLAAARCELPESTATVAARVSRAREAMAARLHNTPWRVNAEVPGPVLAQRYPLPATVTEPAVGAHRAGLLTPRAIPRVLQLAWTLADLAGADRPERDHVETALSLRLPERKA